MGKYRIMLWYVVYFTDWLGIGRLTSRSLTSLKKIYCSTPVIYAIIVSTVSSVKMAFFDNVVSEIRTKP